jgi:RNA polymerase sigma-70 factor (ECF subfamily)
MTLLARVRSRDEEAWQRLVKLYAPLVYYWCQAWGVRGQDADDVVQEVFSGVSTGLANFRRDRPGDTFRGWLRGITRNKLLVHCQKRSQESPASGGTDAYRRLLEVPQSEELPAAPDEDLEETRLFCRGLELVRAEFEPRTWQAFWRSAVEGESPTDIAAELGVTPAAIRKAKSRVLRRLREEIGDVA